MPAAIRKLIVTNDFILFSIDETTLQDARFNSKKLVNSFRIYELFYINRQLTNHNFSPCWDFFIDPLGIRNA